MVRVLASEQYKLPQMQALVFASRQSEHRQHCGIMQPVSLPDHVQLMLGQLAAQHGFKNPR